MIRFYLNYDVLENDIRSLLMAFFPGEPIVRVSDRGQPAGQGLYLEALLQEGQESCGEVTLTMRLYRVPCVSAEPGVIAQPDRSAQPGVSAEPDSVGPEISDSCPVCPGERKECKTRAKCMLYRLLEKLTHSSLPWGTLTGIRPTKIVRSMLAQGASEEECRTYMRERMLCGEKKTDLSLEIAKTELSLLEKLDYERGYSLYIGIPFCPTTCAYCSFTSYPLSRFAGCTDAYLDALEREIDYTAEAFRDKTLNTIYFGGGTPTSLEPYQLERLLNKVKSCFDIRSVLEWTVEAGRPDSITGEKLQVLRRHPVTRISINPQTMKEETLAIIGRRHTVQQVRDAFFLARKEGFDNINMDIIVGLPDETAEDVGNTLSEIAKLGPDNLTVHSLAIKRAARLNTRKEDFSGRKSVNTEEIMEMTQKAARAMGLEPYYLYRQKNMTGNMENVGYARPGREGLYNILIMEEVQTIVALGAGAITKAVRADRIERCENVKDIRTYLEKTDEMIERKKRLFQTLFP